MLDNQGEVSKSIAKLMECVSIGLGIYCNSYFEIRKEKAKSSEKKLFVKAKSDAFNRVAEILSENTENLNDDEDNFNTLFQQNTFLAGLASRSKEYCIRKEMQKQENIENILDYAYEELESVEEVSAIPLEKEWVIRFFSCAEDVTSDIIQKMYGKILAGEIISPDTFSIRTLEALKILSTDEALLFERIAEYRVEIDENIFLFQNKEFYENRFTYSQLTLLEECGIIRVTPMRAFSANIAAQHTMLCKNDEVILICSPHEEGKGVFQIPMHGYTTIGKQLLKLIDIKPDTDTILHFARILQKNNPNFIFSAHKISSIENNTTNYYTENILEEK